VILRGVANVLLPLFGGDNVPNENQITAEEFRAMLNTPEGGALEPDEREILANILELRDIEAKAVMVPRTEMVALDAAVTIQEALDCSWKMGFSRIPVYRKQIDDICGIFHVKDLPFWRDANVKEKTIEDFLAARPLMKPAQRGHTLIRPPLFVLETKKLVDLFAELTRAKMKMAILIDEYGGVSGLVTVEDIIEEIVGEIFDEHDVHLRHPDIIVRPEDASVVEVYGRVSVRQINQRFNLNINEENSDTIGGYVLSLFGRIPSVNDAVTDENGIGFEVAAIAGNQIGAVIMRLPHVLNAEGGRQNVE
jgi:CBS domain containing-hemolysin-like protein